MDDAQWRTPPLAPAAIREADDLLNLKLNLRSSGVSHSYGALSSPSRCKISYSRTAAAALTLSDSTSPAQRQRDELVAGRGDARAQAPALRAEHEHDPAA